MYTKHFILFAFFYLFSIFSFAENLGIAFVHGTSDHRLDAYGEYWKADFIQNMANALPNRENLFVVHCDYSEYMWHANAAECTAQQLLNFVEKKQITSLIVYTHSNGGNVIRWILSNPTYNNRYFQLNKKITKVIAIAPSSAGTPLADLLLNGRALNTGLAWIMGYTGDAIKQQRTGDMKIYNEELLLGTKNRPSMAIPFQTIIGTDVIASPFSSSSYCNGYVLNTGLKLTQLYLEQCADGFLSCSSQSAAGHIWFYDKEKLNEKLPANHNQSRHSCFGMDRALISAFAKEGISQ